MNWISYAFLGMTFFAAMQLIFKKLTTLEVPTEIINFYFFLFSTVAFFIFSFSRQTNLTFPIKLFPVFVLLALIAVVANYCSISAIRSAPNPGYVTGITSFNATIITLASVFLYQSDLSPIKLAGIGLSLGGLILLGL